MANTDTLYRISREGPLLQNTFVSLRVSLISPTIPHGFSMIPSCFPYDSPGVSLGPWLVHSRFPLVPILDSTYHQQSKEELNNTFCLISSERNKAQY